MATVNVLVAVDVEGALASGNLQGNLYMMDTNGFLGSLGEGTSELITVLSNGDTVTWMVASINPGNEVNINSFTGQAVGPNINPVADPTTGAWSSLFTAPGNTPAGTNFQYSIVLAFEGKTMSFDPFLQFA